jgi:hypothetical protein
MPIQGGCLCGGVRFEVDGRLTPIQICHASRCQKSTGSAFAPELAVKRSGFRWLRGEELLESYTAPLLREPPAMRRVFCRVCGSPLPVVRDESDWVVMLAGVLDGDPGVRPFQHIFRSQGAVWYDVHDELPRFDERPPAERRLKLVRGES